MKVAAYVPSPGISVAATRPVGINSPLSPIPAGRYLLVPVLRGGEVVSHARVDPSDRWIANWRWHLSEKGYAITTRQHAGRATSFRMHRVLVGLVHGDQREVDHKNGNRLDNRRRNLRIVDGSQQAQNRCRPGRGAQRSWNGRWDARVDMPGQRVYLGTFDTKAEAAVVASAYRAEHMPLARERRPHRYQLSLLDAL
jgi:HNH endonuclease